MGIDVQKALRELQKHKKGPLRNLNFASVIQLYNGIGRAWGLSVEVPWEVFVKADMEALPRELHSCLAAGAYLSQIANLVVKVVAPGLDRNTQSTLASLLRERLSRERERYRK